MFFECRDILVRRSRETVLDIDHLSAATGEITAIVGPNGAGKTTLLEVLALLRRPNKGQLSLWGQPATGKNSSNYKKLRSDVVLVSHPGYLFRRTVWDNVTFGLRARRISRAQIQSRAAEALDMVGLTELARRDVSKLSAGQRQRVNLARALAIAPKAMLLDEPTANVDAEMISLIADILTTSRDQRGTTIIHTSPTNGALDIPTNKIIHLAAGKVVTNG